jgi:DNA-binding beta-propeller fold protein YncE
MKLFDLKTSKHLKTIKGLETPHAIHYIAETNRLIVSDSGDGMTKIVDGKTYMIAGTIKLTPGADVMSYDPSTKRLWIVTGGKNASSKMTETVLSEVDPATGKHLGDVKFDTDFTEGIAAEQKGNRLFVNVAGKSEVAVLDKSTRKVIATWPVREGQNNAPIGLDETKKRLFVVTRKPFKLVVIDNDTGASVASYDAPQRTNELMFDKALGRIYLAGDDYVGVFKQVDADHYQELARVASAKGAKTAIFVPEFNRLYVAVAGKAPTRAALLQYEVVPTSSK